MAQLLTYVGNGSTYIDVAYPADTTLEIQYSFASDFVFCPSPIIRPPANVASFRLSGLNQRSVYYFRARTRDAQGNVGAWGDVEAWRTNAAGAWSTAPAAVMIEPMMLVVPEPILSIVTAPAPRAGFLAANVLRDSPVPLVIDGANAVGGIYTYEIRFDTGGVDVDTIALLNTVCEESATIEIASISSLAGADPAVIYAGAFRPSVNLPSRPAYHGLWRLGAVRTNRYWRVRITSAVRVLWADYLVVGRNRVSKNHALEKTEESAWLGSMERRRSGTADRISGLQMRKVDVELQMLTETQYETTYRDLVYRQGKPILCVPNAKSGAFFHDRILYGDLTGGRATNPTSPRYNRAFTINSII